MRIPNTKLDHVLPAFHLQQSLIALLMKSRVLILAQRAHPAATPQPPLQPHVATSHAPSFSDPALASLFSSVLHGWTLCFRSYLNVTSSKWPSLSTLSINSLCRSLLPITLHISHITPHKQSYLVGLHVYYLSPRLPKCNPIRAVTFWVLSLLYPQCRAWAQPGAASAHGCGMHGALGA